MLLRVISIFLILFLFSCSNRDTEAARAQEIYDQANKIHDEIMPMMGKIYRQQQRLQSMLTILKKDSIQYADKIKLIENRLDALNTAGDAMMDWMHTVRVPPGMTADPMQPADTLTGGIEIQRVQLKAIEDVRDAMEKSIANAAAIQE